MVVAVRCKCLNVTIHLEHAAVSLGDEPHWLASHATRCRLGRSAISVAGVCTAVNFLLETKVLDHQEESWRCTTCINCDWFIYAYCITKPSMVIVNMDLLPNIAAHERLTLGDSYSKVWRIILNDEDNIANSVIETPGEDEPEKLTLFQTIRHQMRQYLQQAELDMQERIRLFTEQQHQMYQEEQAKAFMDRKLVWFKACKGLPNSSNTATAAASASSSASAKSAAASGLSSNSTDDTTSSSSSITLTSPHSRQSLGDSGTSFSASPVRSNVHLEEAGGGGGGSAVSSPLSPIAVPATPETQAPPPPIEHAPPPPSDFAPPPPDQAPAPPTPIKHSPYATSMSNGNGKGAADLGIFHFDDLASDDADSTAPSEVEEPAPTDDHFDVIDDGYDDYRPKRGPMPGQYLACSMPVEVPARFRAFGLPREERANEQAPQALLQQYRREERPTREAEVGMLSQSFAVPISRTKQMKGLL